MVKMPDEIKAETTPEVEVDVETEAEAEVETKETLQIDYKAELERERSQREKAEKALAEKAFKFRDKKRTEDEPDEYPEEKPLTRREVDELLERNAQRVRSEMQSTVIEEKARKLSNSEDEARLIMEIHRNRTFPSGLTLDEQVEEAWAIANKGKLRATIGELKRSLTSKESANNNPAGTHRDPQVINEPTGSADVLALKAAGYTWNGKSRLYVASTNNGKRVLTYDPRTKKRSVIEK